MYVSSTFINDLHIEILAGKWHFGSNLQCACVRSIFRLHRNIAHFFGNVERTDDSNLLSFGVSYNFVAQKWRILAIFYKKINFWEIIWKVLGFKTMFKS